MFNGEQTLRNKLGITVDVAKTNPSADLGMTVFGAVGVRPLSSAERQFMQNGVERVYETFVGHVAEGRNMSVAAVDSIGGGRVWSGIDAVRIGLVDGFGGLREAIALAADRAGVAATSGSVTAADGARSPVAGSENDVGREPAPSCSRASSERSTRSTKCCKTYLGPAECRPLCLTMSGCAEARDFRRERGLSGGALHPTIYLHKV